MTIDITPPKADVVSTDEADEKVVQLRTAPDERMRIVVDNTKRNENHCRGLSHQITVDPYTRSVSCGLCGAVLDAFDALHDLAKRHERQAGWYSHRHKELRAIEARIDDLKRIEGNARSRIKRAGGQVPDKYEQDEILNDLLRAWIEGKQIRVTYQNKAWTAKQARDGAAQLVRLAMKLEANR